MMLGSIPQQDVFQRVMSSNNAATARKGPVIGGLLYLLFAFIPCLWSPLQSWSCLKTAQALLEDPRRYCPPW